MAVPRKEAQKICSESEFDLIKSSYEKGARAGKPGRLKEKMKLVRRLRDKYRDIARRQRRHVRRQGLSVGEPELPEESPEAPPPSRLQRLLAQAPKPLHEWRDPDPEPPPAPDPRPRRIVEDTAADRATRKAEVFEDALRRLEGELSRHS